MSGLQSVEDEVAEALIVGLRAQVQDAVHGIEVEVGERHGLNLEQLRQALVARLGVEVVVTLVPIVHQCTQCGAEFPAEEHPCPVCGSAMVTEIHGDELGIRRAWRRG